jgi:4'-phosphopantetheinyl transferase
MIRFSTKPANQAVRPTCVQVESGQIDVWLIPLVNCPMPLEQMDGWLAETERARAAGFLLESQMRRYTICRAAIRQILGQYLGRPPAALRIEVRSDGKPCLNGGAGGIDLRFNLSHSGDLAVLAVASGLEVGVDLEQVRRISGFDRMVQRCLEPTERDRVLSSPPEDRERQFLRYWTHKEAYLKTFGVGLRRRLQDVVVDLDAPAYWRIVSHAELFPADVGVSLVEMTVGDQFVGAVGWASAGAHRLIPFTWEGASLENAFMEGHHRGPHRVVRAHPK